MSGGAKSVQYYNTGIAGHPVGTVSDKSGAQQRSGVFRGYAGIYGKTIRQSATVISA